MREHYIKIQAKALLNKKPVKKGDLIVSSEPFAFAINTDHVSEYCGYCFKPYTKGLLSYCKTCRVQWYCSDSCERLGWDVHQYECKPLAKLGETPPSFIRLLARIIFKLQNGGHKIVEKYNQREGRRFRDLMNHYHDVKNDKEAQEELDQAIPALKRYIGEQNLPNYADLLGIYGRVLVNRFCLFDDTMMTFGSGVFLAASIFDHSCIPNCSVSFSGRKVQIRSLIDMKELDYSKLRISYVDPVCSSAHRREDLLRKWFFLCDCKVCADQERIEMENSVICDTEDCDSKVYIPEDFTKGESQPACKVCKRPVDAAKVRKYREAVVKTKKALKEMSEENPSLQECLDVIEVQGDMFHSLNVWRVRILDFAFNACVFNGVWSLVYDFGDRNYEGMRYYYGAFHPTFGLFLYKLGKAKIYLKEFREGVDHLDDAQRVLSIALGPNHSLVAEEIVSLSLLANEDPQICMERLESSSRQKMRL